MLPLIHQCPITDLVFHDKCVVSTCVWFTNKSSTGCMHELVRHDSITRADIAQYKDTSDMAAAKDRIQAILVLDRYVAQSGVPGNTPIPESIRAACTASPLLQSDLFPSLSMDTLSHLCLATTFAKFVAKFPVKMALPAVLFLNPAQIELISSFKELT